MLMEHSDEFYNCKSALLNYLSHNMPVAMLLQCTTNVIMNDAL